MVTALDFESCQFENYIMEAFVGLDPKGGRVGRYTGIFIHAKTQAIFGDSQFLGPNYTGSEIILNFNILWEGGGGSEK